ncbi:MAG TPA: hypothetical protein VNO31_46330 [Umezawaea sp.]|nr:hypothetical protein [Umezawaea sp.]
MTSTIIKPLGANMILISSALRCGLAAAGAALAVACTATPRDSTVPAPTPSGAPSVAASSAATTSGTGSGSVKLGDQNKPADAAASGATFDPCKVPGWSAFPAAVKPKNEADKPPRQRTPKAKDPFTVACFYDNSEASSTSAAGKHFVATVLWAPKGKMPVDPGLPENQADDNDLESKVQAKTIAGRPGLLRSGKNAASKEPSCGALVELSDGSTAGALLVNGQFPGQDTCQVVEGVVAAVVAATS